MDILYNRIFWCEMVDPNDPDNRFRIFGDREGDKIYVEKNNNIIELDNVQQAQLASFIIQKITNDLKEQSKIARDVKTNLQ